MYQLSGPTCVSSPPFQPIYYHKKARSFLWCHHHFWEELVLAAQVAPPNRAVREGALHLPPKHKPPHLQNPHSKSRTSWEDLCFQVIRFQKWRVFFPDSEETPNNGLYGSVISIWCFLNTTKNNSWQVILLNNFTCVGKREKEKNHVFARKSLPVSTYRIQEEIQKNSVVPTKIQVLPQKLPADSKSWAHFAHLSH